MTRPNAYLVLLLALVSLALVSCGSRKKIGNFGESSTLSSREPIDETDPLNVVSKGPAANCNDIEGGGFEGSTEIYRNSQGGIHNDVSRIRISRPPSNIDDDLTNLQFFRWKADSSGVELDSRPVAFFLEDRGSAFPVSGNIETLTKTDIDTIALRAYGQAMTITDFLTRVNFVVMNLDIQWDALKLAHYLDTAMSSEVDFLIPGYIANPNNFASDHPLVLNQLHPLASEAAKNLDSIEYYAMTQSFCL